MGARPAFRNRDDVEVAVLDALVDRGKEGMTVLELRAAVDADIDRLEAALASLKEDDLITVEEADDRLRIRPDDCVVPDGPPEEEPGLVEVIRDRLGL